MSFTSVKSCSFFLFCLSWMENVMFTRNCSCANVTKRSNSRIPLQNQIRSLWFLLYLLSPSDVSEFRNFDKDLHKILFLKKFCIPLDACVWKPNYALVHQQESDSCYCKLKLVSNQKKKVPIQSCFWMLSYEDKECLISHFSENFQI